MWPKKSATPSAGLGKNYWTRRRPRPGGGRKLKKEWALRAFCPGMIFANILPQLPRHSVRTVQQYWQGYCNHVSIHAVARLALTARSGRHGTFCLLLTLHRFSHAVSRSRLSCASSPDTSLTLDTRDFSGCNNAQYRTILHVYCSSAVSYIIIANQLVFLFHRLLQ